METLHDDTFEDISDAFVIPSQNDLIDLQRRVENVVDGSINHKVRNLAGTMYAVFSVAGQKWPLDQQVTWLKSMREFKRLEQKYKEQKAREEGLI